MAQLLLDNYPLLDSSLYSPASRSEVISWLRLVPNATGKVVQPIALEPAQPQAVPSLLA